MNKLFRPLVLLTILMAAAAAYADTLQTFNLGWSGDAFGNSAVATGQITIDTTTLPNPGSYSDSGNLPSWISSLTVTVSGANSGNGVFTLSDFSGAYWNTAGGTLDLTQQLIGQATNGNPWGTTHDSTSGDFNLFNSLGGSAPSGTFFFQLTTNHGQGDNMYLTNFSPATPSIPEPSSLLLFGSALFGLAGAVRRKLNA